MKHTTIHTTDDYSILIFLLQLFFKMMKYIFYMLTIAWVTGADWLTPICYRKSSQAGTVVTPN